MNRCYYIMGIGLLSVASLTSCEEDVIEKDTRYAGSLSTYTVYAGIQGYGSDEEGLSTRANVQENGKSFMWNTDDRVTIWDGAKGYAFAAEGDDLDANPSRKVTFTGEASFEDEAKVLPCQMSQRNRRAVNRRCSIPCICWLRGLWKEIPCNV